MRGHNISRGRQAVVCAFIRWGGNTPGLYSVVGVRLLLFVLEGLAMEDAYGTFPCSRPGRFHALRVERTGLMGLKNEMLW